MLRLQQKKAIATVNDDRQVQTQNKISILNNFINLYSFPELVELSLFYQDPNLIIEFMFLQSWKSLEGTHLKDKYLLETLLGIGGFGAVFLSKTVGHDGAIAKVAVKLMVWDSKREKEQTQELELATTLKHDRLINFVDLDH
ncbi:hypothetical protein BEST7613_2637 [Synechocystis sp. PCC 6803]|nr:hypothetical protein BEST7613_2637 [Synechocystis sp. PCC 6803] [Bacillus subtilis BEST7613]